MLRRLENVPEWFKNIHSIMFILCIKMLFFFSANRHSSFFNYKTYENKLSELDLHGSKFNLVFLKPNGQNLHP